MILSIELKEFGTAVEMLAKQKRNQFQSICWHALDAVRNWDFFSAKKLRFMQFFHFCDYEYIPGGDGNFFKEN